MCRSQEGIAFGEGVTGNRLRGLPGGNRVRVLDWGCNHTGVFSL